MTCWGISARDLLYFASLIYYRDPLISSLTLTASEPVRMSHLGLTFPYNGQAATFFVVGTIMSVKMFKVRLGDNIRTNFMQPGQLLQRQLLGFGWVGVHVQGNKYVKPQLGCVGVVLGF